MFLHGPPYLWTSANLWELMLGEFLVIGVVSFLVYRFQLRPRILALIESLEIEKQRVIQAKRQNEQLNTAQELSHSGSWEWDIATDQIVWSDELYRVFGRAVGEVPANTEQYLAALLPQDRGFIQASLQKALRDKSSFSYQHQILTPDQKIRTLQCSGKVILDEAGNRKYMRGSCQDITFQKEIELNLQKALQARDEFLSIAAHELKTPLTSLTLQLQLLQKMGEQLSFYPESRPKISLVNSEDKFKLLLEASEKARKKLTTMVDQLLDSTKIRAGKLSIEIQTVNLTEIIQALVKQFSEEAGKHGVQVTLKCASTHIIGRLDPFRIEQVMNNLLTNALKYGNHSPIKVDLEKISNQNRAKILVCDSGPGIPHEFQTKIFEKFERVLGTSKISGLGLGLYIVRKIVEAHNGTIRLESSLGQGSTFIVELPL